MPLFGGGGKGGGGSSSLVGRGYFSSFLEGGHVVHVCTLARSFFPMRLSIDAALSLLHVILCLWLVSLLCLILSGLFFHC